MESKDRRAFRKWYRVETGKYLYILPSGRLSTRKMPKRRGASSSPPHKL